MTSKGILSRFSLRSKEAKINAPSSKASSQSQSLSEKQSLGLTILAEGINPIVDIVAVHGLNGRREETWTASNRILWLRDLLPSDLPNARIFSWGYNANTHSTSHLDQQYIYNHAKTLISDLCRKRQVTETYRRPIIFIAHSLGGIVVKSVLIHSDAAREGALEEHRSIAVSTYGIFYMGTPHQGGNGVTFGKALVNIASIFVKAVDKILKNLERDSEFLQQQLGQYAPISGQFVTKFAFETVPTPIALGKAVMVVPTASAVVPGVADVEPVAIAENHINMVKFLSRSDGGYEKILEYLILMVKLIQDKINARWELEERRKKVQLVDEPFIIPFSLAGLPYIKNYIARDEEMLKLEQSLLSKIEGTRQSIFVLYGLGGIGKTQMAIEYARKHQEIYSAIFWLNGDTLNTLLLSFAAIAQRLPGKLGEKGHTGDLEENARLALHWLSTPRNKGWLLIYDNIDRDWSRDGPDPEAYDLLSYFPPSDHGSIIITTRLQNLAHLGDNLSVGRVTFDEGLRILSNNAMISEITKDHERLVSELDRLPLALVQAGRYLFSTKISPKKYLELYRTSWPALQEKAPRLQDYKNRSVHTTWTISYEHICKSNPTAATLLKLWAYFDKQDLWYELLASGASKQPEWYQKLVKSELDFRNAVETLLNYSLVESHSLPDSYAMHSVVHDWCFELFNEDSAQEMTQIVLIAVGQAVPYRDNLEDLILGRRLLSHATRYVQCIGYGYTSGGLMDELSIVLDSLFNLGVLFCDQGRLAEAEAMCQRALAGKEKALGLEHLLTLDTVYSLGVLFWNQGRLAEAEAMYQCALVGYEKALGPEHRSTLTTVHNLGILFRDQGRLAESEAIYQRTLSRKTTL